MRARLALVGAAGAGKSTVAADLAGRWSAPLIDTDEQFVGRTGRTVGEAIVDDEPTFREAEERIALEALDTPGAVVALGSGAIDSERLREALAGVPVVWLQVGLADSARRTGLSVPRPVALGNVRAQLQQMLDQRAELYEQVCDLAVATDGRMVESVSDEIERWEVGRGTHD